MRPKDSANCSTFTGSIAEIVSVSGDIADKIPNLNALTAFSARSNASEARVIAAAFSAALVLFKAYESARACPDIVTLRNSFPSNCDFKNACSDLFVISPRPDITFANMSASLSVARSCKLTPTRANADCSPAEPSAAAPILVTNLRIPFCATSLLPPKFCSASPNPSTFATAMPVESLRSWIASAKFTAFVIAAPMASPPMAVCSLPNAPLSPPTLSCKLFNACTPLVALTFTL